MPHRSTAWSSAAAGSAVQRCGVRGWRCLPTSVAVRRAAAPRGLSQECCCRAVAPRRAMYTHSSTITDWRRTAPPSSFRFFSFRRLPRPGGQDTTRRGEGDMGRPKRLVHVAVPSPTPQHRAQNCHWHRRGHHPPAPRACAPRRQDRQAGSRSSLTPKQILGISRMPADKGRACSMPKALREPLAATARCHRRRRRLSCQASR